MNTTYQRVWTIADLEWKYSKSYYLSHFLFPSATLPGPLRPLYYLAKYLYRRDSCDCTGFLAEERRREKEVLGENYRQYKEKLKEILREKNDTDSQKMLEEKRADNAVLRKEVAELRDMVKTVLTADGKRTKHRRTIKRTKKDVRM